VSVLSTQHPERDAAAAVVGGAIVAFASAAALASRYSSSSGSVWLAGVIGMLPATLSAAAIVRRTPPTSTPADQVTLGRAVLASGCAAITVLVLADEVPARTWWLLAIVVPTLLLDAVDGWVARRTNTSTTAGALFDMQLDAGVLVVLCLAVAPVVGWWVLAIGAMRYLLVAASWRWPILSMPLPRSNFRRFVAGLQGAVLAATIPPLLPVALCQVGLLVALALLFASFGHQLRAVALRLRSP
jgi:phosphatidylglycerophosphate synthase